MNKQTAINAVVAAVIVIVVIVGYNALVIQPKLQPSQEPGQGVFLAPAEVNNLHVRQGARIEGNAAVGGNVEVAGTVSAGAIISEGAASLTSLETSEAITATGGFVGDLTGNVTGNVTGDVTGIVTGTVTASALTVGGGYGATGCTVSAAGVLQCNGAATVDGALTATSGIVINGLTFTMTAPITVTNLCNNCRVLFVQLP